MVLLQEGDNRVVRLVQNINLKQDKKYRLSAWVFCTAVADSVVVYNSLSKRIYRLNRQEWDAVREGVFSSLTVQELLKHRFLVETDFNDLAQYQMVVGALQNIQRAPGTKTFTILPTTGCNARCVYCYEQGIAALTMTAAVADRVIDYISETKQKGKIKLHWFGGEPLCNPEMITRICTGLKNQGIEFTSSITTNGSLFTPALIRDAVALWNLERAQVSMDGEREDYEERKRFIRPDLYNYSVVMENIRQLAESGVKVVIRCNCDLENMQRAYRFVDDCADRFGKNENVFLVPALLNQGRLKPEKSLVSHSRLRELKKYAAERMPRQRSGSLPQLHFHQCMADSGGRGVLIDPAGGLHVCEEKVGEKPLGSIFDPAPPVWPTSPLNPAEECSSCCFLPDCTPWYRIGCPVCPVDCRKVKELNVSKNLEMMLLEKAVNIGTEAKAPSEEFC